MENQIQTITFNMLPMTIGVLPSSYVDSMSYYETLVWLCNYLENTVIPAVNNNGEAVEELQTAYIQLHDYVEHYFDNLDVQTEINNKLDEMTEDGSLTNLISAYVDPIYQAYEENINEIVTAQNGEITNFKNSVNTQIGQQNSTISAIQSAVQSAVSSAPIPVSSTDDMTDTTKIYVNTTDGYWYYYDGDSWEQGGVYQAAQSSDTVLNTNQYLKSINAKNLMDWIVGDINQGSISTSSYRIVTNTIQCFKEYLYINFSAKIKYGIWTYSDSLGTNPQWGGWQAGDNKKSHVIPANTYFRLVVDYTDNSDPDRIVITNAYTSTLYSYLEIYKYFKYQDYCLLKNNKLISFKENPMYNMILATGDIANGAIVIDPAAKRRLITLNIQCLPYDIILPHKSLSENTFYLVTYSNANGDNYKMVGWVSKDVTYTIPKGTYFRLIIARNNSDSVDPVGDIFESDLYNNIRILKTRYVENKNIESVAHQGFSTNGQALGNCRLSSYLGAKLAGFTAGECDIQWTSDAVPVCCHDASFVDGEDTIVIHDHTFAELQNYNYYGETIASLDQVVEYCKQLGLNLYIDHIYHTWSTSSFDKIINIIKHHAMLDNVKFLVLTKACADILLSYYDKFKIAYVTEDSDISSLITDANNTKTDKNEVSIDFKWGTISTANLQTYSEQLADGVYFETWTVDYTTYFTNALKYVKGITSNKISYSAYYLDKFTK